MKIRIEPNENFLEEIKTIQKEVNMLHGGIEEQVRTVAHAVENLIAALIDAEEGDE